jgi:hypothetical protein
MTRFGTLTLLFGIALFCFTIVGVLVARLVTCS